MMEQRWCVFVATPIRCPASSSNTNKQSTFRCLLTAKLNRNSLNKKQRLSLARSIIIARERNVPVFPSTGVFPQWRKETYYWETKLEGLAGEFEATDDQMALKKAQAEIPDLLILYKEECRPEYSYRMGYRMDIIWEDPGFHR